MDKNYTHKPVLLTETLTALDIQKGDTIIDATLGLGGHTKAFLEKTGSSGLVLGIDKDTDALTQAQKNLKNFKNVEYSNTSFANIKEIVEKRNIQPNIIFADIGVSSLQLDKEERGFSFRFDAPLDMRMDTTQEEDAKTILNTYSKEKLQEIFIQYGEIDEKTAKELAHNIGEARKNFPIQEVPRLLQIIEKTNIKIKNKKKQQKYKQKVFQALRIQVNNELEDLGRMLESSFGILSPGSKIGIITFHSLEDKIVKNFFREKTKNLSKKHAKIIKPFPIKPSLEEIWSNPRSKSANLRVISIEPGSHENHSNRML